MKRHGSRSSLRINRWSSARSSGSDATTYDDTTAAIATTYSAKFFRLKNLRKEGMSYVENIGKMR